jgi:photosystem II stability/assembly factor-like uncharacterized protein
MHRAKLILMIFYGLLAAFDRAIAQTWTQTSAPTSFWSCVASSADGTKLVAAIADGYNENNYIYASTNSGITWAPTIALTNFVWSSAASSADGSKLFVAAFANDSKNSGGAIFISTNSGANWTQTSAPTNNYWTSIASSADGSKLVAVGNGIFTSTNSGTTWTQQTNPRNISWFSVVSSADGTKLVIQVPDVIYRSTNSGVTWTQITPPPILWPGTSSRQVIASSADGTRLVAAFYGDANFNACPIFLSTNSGTTWTATSAPSNNWNSVSSSADGTKIVALAGSAFGPQNIGPIYTSTDSGETWTSNNVPNEEWTSVACSADGNKLVAVSGVYALGLIYTSYSTPVPQLNLAYTNNALNLSWLVPSTNFVLRQNFYLTTTNWTDMTNIQALNLTNLQYQVILSPSNTSSFYRLATP